MDVLEKKFFLTVIIFVSICFLLFNISLSLLSYQNIALSVSFIIFIVFGTFIVYKSTIGNLLLQCRTDIEKWKNLALLDDLTQIPNRFMFKMKLKENILSNPQHKIAILFIDLDDFKNVNDMFLHYKGGGDEVLKGVAVRIREQIRKSDMVARFGGDEFVVILTPIESPDYAAKVASRIIQAICKPFDIYGKMAIIGASIGISIYPDEAFNMDDLITKADIAMYSAKHDGGGNTYRLWSMMNKHAGMTVLPKDL